MSASLNLLCWILKSECKFFFKCHFKWGSSGQKAFVQIEVLSLISHELIPVSFSVSQMNEFVEGCAQK